MLRCDTTAERALPSYCRADDMLVCFPCRWDGLCFLTIITSVRFLCPSFQQSITWVLGRRLGVDVLCATRLEIVEDVPRVLDFASFGSADCQLSVGLCCGGLFSYVCRMDLDGRPNDRYWTLQMPLCPPLCGPWLKRHSCVGLPTHPTKHYPWQCLRGTIDFLDHT
jgi:hypothetical protein